MIFSIFSSKSAPSKSRAVEKKPVTASVPTPDRKRETPQGPVFRSVRSRPLSRA